MSSSRKRLKRRLYEYVPNQQIKPPLVLSTLLSKELNSIVDIPEVQFLNVFDQSLMQVEDYLGQKALWEPGASRHPDHITIMTRVEAILLGVSRSGKTPISVYLATQMGIKVANYPLVEEDLNSFRLPPYIIRNKKKIVGLSTKPEILQQHREHRYGGSNYAKISTCRDEINKANRIYLDHQIPIIMSSERSMEEVATLVMQELNLGSKANL